MPSTKRAVPVAKRPEVPHQNSDNITDPKRTQEGMRTSEIRYRRLFEAARDGILILNGNTLKITDVNPFMTEL